MTLEQAHQLSLALAVAGFNHTISVGVYPNMVMPVQARVELEWPRDYAGRVVEAVTKLDEIAKTCGLIVCSSFMGQGLTFATQSETDELLGKLR